MGSHRKTKRAKEVAWKLDDSDWKRIEHLFPVHQVSPKEVVHVCPTVASSKL